MACWIYRTAEPKRWHVGQARMSAHRFCEPVERRWPWLWRLK
jgi:hypothetical protein